MRKGRPEETVEPACTEVVLAGVGRDGASMVQGLGPLPGVVRRIFLTASPTRAVARAAELVPLRDDGAWCEELRTALSGAQMLLLVSAFTGREETYGPQILDMARERNALAVAVLAEPLLAGSPHKTEAGARLFKKVAKAADATMLFPADRGNPALLTVAEAFDSWNRRLSASLDGLIGAATADDAMNMDFTDIASVLSGHCRATVGVGEDKLVADALRSAVKKALAPPGELRTARSVLAHVVGDGEMPLDEARRAGTILQQLFPKAEVCCGVSVVEEAPAIRATLIAGTLDESAQETKKEIRTLEAESPFFKVGDPTVYDGENLDIPTFLRKDIPLPGAEPEPVPAQQTLFDGPARR